MSGDAHCDGEELTGHAIIAGFGVPGRAAAESLSARRVPYCVIELNPQTVHRCAKAGTHIIAGDVCSEDTLRRAGVERATLLVLAVPAEQAVLEAVRVARRLNPSLRIVARCHFISSGMEARRRGADDVVVEEQAVAEEMTKLLDTTLVEPLHAGEGPP